jgi:hypothetical protein
MSLACSRSLARQALVLKCFPVTPLHYLDSSKLHLHYLPTDLHLFPFPWQEYSYKSYAGHPCLSLSSEVLCLAGSRNDRFAHLLSCDSTAEAEMSHGGLQLEVELK